MNLEELRTQIDGIDSQLVKLFCQRMDCAAQIAAYKKEHGLAVQAPGRERELLASVAAQAGEEMAEYTEAVYKTILAVSRSYQNSRMGRSSKTYEGIRQVLSGTPELFPQRATVACQGTEGAYSQLACERLFKTPSIMYFNNFEHVFKAVETGMCRYGILPIENSTAGSVNQTYDLMIRHNFSIVRSVRLKVDHNLLARPGATMSGIREIYSHQQAISQSQRFLQSLPGVRVIPCANTAEAAKRVAESGRSDVAALASRSCIELYGLKCLAESVQDQDNNYTRFICISKELEIYPGANRTSLMAVLPHEPGSLYKLLSRFYALDVNLNKLESRPLTGRDFEFMFYFDLDAPVYDPRFMQLMGELEGVCERFVYLGSYGEVI